MERKFTTLQSVDASEGQVSGYASVFGGVDSYGDTILKGAYRETLREIKKAKGLPLLWSHSQFEVIGRWTDLEEDEHGLKVTGELTPNHSGAANAHASLKAGHVDGLSIGFSVLPGGATENDDGTRTLKKIKLHEISIVAFPADSAARVSGVKAAADLTEREFERTILKAMRDAGAEMTRSDAIALMRGGYKSLIAKRDAGGRLEAEAVIKTSLLEAIRSARS